MGNIAIQVTAPVVGRKRVIIENVWTVKRTIEIMIRRWNLDPADEFELNFAGERLDYDSRIENTPLVDGSDVDLLAWGSNV